MGTKRSSGTVHTPKGVNQGNTLIDPNTGQPVDVITDSQGKKRLAVDANITAQIGELEVDLDYETDSVSVGDPNSGNILKINPDGSIDTNVEIDATGGDSIQIVGTEDGTPTGIQHTVKIDAAGNVIVKDQEIYDLLNTIRQSRAIDVAFDDIEVLTKNDDGNPVSIAVRYLGSLVRTLTLQYDADGDFQRIQKS